MFYSLCIALCLAVMFLVSAFAALVSVPLVRPARTALPAARPRTQANFWLLFRLFPFVLAATVSLGLALPSFLEFEPHSTGEMMKWHLLALAGLGAVVLGVIVVRALRMLCATRRLAQRWISRSQMIGFAASFPLYLVSDTSSLLAVTGILRPKIFVSSDVAEALTDDELSAALAHELVHIRRFDNLQQIALKSTQWPLRALRAADAGWASATEIAADESAVRHGTSALELSSALIKVGRLSGKTLSAQRLAASHLVPCGCAASTGTRVAHLRELLDKDSSLASPAPGHGFVPGIKLLATVLFVLMYFACVATLLPAVHEALEFLVR